MIQTIEMFQVNEPSISHDLRHKPNPTYEGDDRDSYIVNHKRYTKKKSHKDPGAKLKKLNNDNMYTAI